MANIGDPIRRITVVPVRHPIPETPEPKQPAPPVKEPEKTPERVPEKVE